jgi:hypothetical protein
MMSLKEHPVDQKKSRRAKNVQLRRHFSTLAVRSLDKNQHMPSRIKGLLVFIAFCAIVWLGTNTGLAQSSVAQFQRILREKATFDETEFAAVKQGQTVVKLLPVLDKREVAVCGLVSLQAPAEEFLQSFRENMTRKNNPAVLEIGSFSNLPTLDDLQALTIETRDIEDLKECVVGDCQLKLSAAMIERFRKEVNWQTPDYQLRATQLLKQLLLDYVQDYLARGDSALIEYNDKPKGVRLAEEQRSLMAASGYVNDVHTDLPQYLKGFPRPGLRLVENAIVWSKIKFGLKPVIAINHIMIYKREQGPGLQVLIASKQIYANHYFNSSLALTAFVNIPGASPESYLVYENRSRADGLEGAFSKFKRRIVEKKAVNGLKAILEQSQANLNARELSQTESAPASHREARWKRWKVGGAYLVLLILITAFVALFVLGNIDWKSDISGGAHR